jgi:hypothetical protein
VLRISTDDADGPAVWLGKVGQRGKAASWCADCVLEFVEVAAAEYAADGTGERDTPLLATPVVGTRYGGANWQEKGDILVELIRRLTYAADRLGVDVVLVTWGEDEREALAMYSAAQRARRTVMAGTPLSHTWKLGPGQLALEVAASELAHRGKAGQLVLFLGAGVSASARLPTWQGLIDGLARSAGLGDSEIERLRRLDLRDQATILQRRDGQLRVKIAESLTAVHYPLTGALLASLPTKEAITTNYDTLFEAAVEARHQVLRTLPYVAVTDPNQRWLLKLHGSIETDADDIVLTRDDYLGAPSRHAALFGLVQAMLLTRHLLFVGYSLSDDDFHQIIHEVKMARGTSDADQSCLGTALVLTEDDLKATLWEDIVGIVPMSAQGDAPASRASESARRLQILLDLVGYLAADLSGFLLAEGFAALLDDDEADIAEALTPLTSLSPEDPQLHEKICVILRSFGYA